MTTLVEELEVKMKASGKSRRRWVKVDVEEEVFNALHLLAAESRMRIQPFLRRYLAEARSYSVPAANGDTLSFSSKLNGSDRDGGPAKQPQ